MTIEAGDVNTAPGHVGCKHTCSFGCGNEYEFVVTTASDSTTQFLCVPCFIGTAADMLAAVTDPDNPAVMLAVESYDADTVQPLGTRGRKSKRASATDAEAGSDIFDDFEPDISES